MITREEFEDTLKEMASLCDKIADAGEQVSLLSKQEKALIAELKNQCNEKSNAAKEDFAYDSSAYRDQYCSA